MELDADETVTRVLAERRELLRRAALSAIRRADGGDVVDADHLRWCREFVAANPPLSGPLGTGEPVIPAEREAA
jgi:hypothetical protein